MTNVERVYNELLISKSKQRQIENLLQEVRKALQNGEEYHHIQLERKMLNIIANVDYDHHMVEVILQAYMKDRRWAEIFPALYGDMIEHQSFLETSLDKGTQRKTTENELPSLTQCTA